MPPYYPAFPSAFRDRAAFGVATFGAGGGFVPIDDDYLLRDLYPGAIDPLVTGGKRTVTGAFFYLDNTGLRNGGQLSSPTWGASEVRYASVPITRANGIVMLTLHTPEDAENDYAYGLSTSATAIDPRTDGHGLLIESKAFNVISAGVKVLLDSDERMTRPMQYLVATVLMDEGAAVYICSFGLDTGAGMTYPAGIPAYPTMRLLYVTRNSTTTPLYPYVSALDRVSGGYTGGHRFQDLRVFTVDEWASNDALADAADRFTRADSALTLGASWTSDNGTFGISSNQAYAPSVSGFGRAWMESGVADCIVTARITIPAGGFRSFGLMVRRQDANNFIRVWFDSAAALIQTWVAGGFGATIASTALALTAGQTYRIAVIMTGNRYRLYVNDVATYGVSWATDANSRFITATKHGFYILDSAGYTDARWDDFAVYPLSITAPAQLQIGAIPTIFVPGATLASDTFTDTNGTALSAHTPTQGSAWVENVGGWTIESNRATLSTPEAGEINFVTQDIGQTHVEASVSFRLETGEEELYAGIVVCYVDPLNFIAVLPLRVPIQPNNDEIELYEFVNGAGSSVVDRKVNVGLGASPYYVAGESHDLKVQVSTDNTGAEIVQVWLDGAPRITYPRSANSPAGTRAGLVVQRDGYNDFTTFDNWTVKAL